MLDFLQHGFQNWQKKQGLFQFASTTSPDPEIWELMVG